MPPDLKALQEQVKHYVLMPLLVLPAIHVIMFLIGGGPNPLRFAAAVAYFGALAAALWYGRQLLPTFLDKYYSWRYGRAHPMIRMAARLLVLATQSVTALVTQVLLPFVGFAALSVLSYWLGGLMALQPGIDILWLLAGAVVLGVLFFNDGRFFLAWERWRFLREEIELDPDRGGDPRTANKDEPPFAIAGELAFRAASQDWSWPALRQNMLVLGMVGSGKTVCVLNTMLDALLSCSATAKLRPAVMILDAKGDYLDKIRILCRKLGREGDLAILDPEDLEHSERWNPFDSADPAFEIAERFGAACQMLNRGGGANDAFWVESAKRFVQNAITLLRHTNPGGEPPSFRQIMRLATDFEEIGHAAGRITPKNKAELESTVEYFSDQWTTLPPETRGGVQAFINVMLGPFLDAPYTTLLAGRSTISLARVVDEGRILYIHMPTAQREAMARFISTLMKLEFQREVLRRNRKERYSLFFCDEFQMFLTTGDASFFEKSREANHVNIIATQSLQAVLDKVERREGVMSVFGNCAVKVFLRNDDADTVDYAAKLLGERPMRTTGEQRSSSGRMQDLMRGGGTLTTSTTTHFKYPPETFRELVIPSREGSSEAESVTYLANQPTMLTRRLYWPIHPLT
jgi:hypothetical protein